MHLQYAGVGFTLITRTAVLILNVVAAIFLITASVLQQQYYQGDNAIGDFIQFAPVGWSLLWTITSLVMNFRGRTYHPGVDIPMEFFGWGLVIGTVWYIIYNVAVYGEYVVDYCEYQSQTVEADCNPTRGRILRTSEIIASVMIIGLGLLHFVLFVLACRAVDRRRMQEWANRNASHELENRSEPYKQ